MARRADTDADLVTAASFEGVGGEDGSDTDEDAFLSEWADELWDNKYQYLNLLLFTGYLVLISSQVIAILEPFKATPAVTALRYNFASPQSSTSKIAVADVGSSADLWEWLVEVLIPAAFVDDMYGARFS